MPVTASGNPSEETPDKRSVPPTLSEFLLANFFPTMHSAAPSWNQAPSTCHHGFVCPRPVTNAPPSGNFTSRADQVPIRIASPLGESFTNAAEAGENRGVEEATLASRMGAKATMLLCQKMDLIL